MKNFLFFLFIFFVYGCTSNNQAYWCGDHPCINEKEREAYFKKTMIIEVREIEKKDIKNNSQIDQITEQAVLDEKKRIKEEKNLLKRAKLEEKKRIKTEKQKAKKAKLEEKRKIKAERTKAREAKLKEKKKN